MSISCKGKDLLFLVKFISLWFGGCKLSEIPRHELERVMNFFGGK